MTRVLHVIASVSSRNGGPTFALMNLVEMFKSSTVRCGVAIAQTSADDEPFMTRLSEAGAEVYQWPAERFSPYSFSMGFSRDCSDIIRRYDVLHIHSMWNWPAYMAALVAHRLGIPVIFRPAGALDSFDLQKHSVLKRVLGPIFLRRLFMSPNLFHCTARREATNLVAYGGNANRVVLPLPVAQIAGGGPLARATLRQALEIPEEAPVILFMGRINYKKGLDILVPAIAEVRRTHDDLHLVLAGDGSTEISSRVQALVAASGFTAYMRMTGFVTGDYKTALLAACDLFVLPSRNENFGVSVVEALSSGMPVVITDGVYLSDDIGSERAVCVCRGTVEGVATGLLTMLERIRSRGIQDSARDLWRDRFSFASLRVAYEKLYQLAVNKTVL